MFQYFYFIYLFLFQLLLTKGKDIELFNFKLCLLNTIQTIFKLFPVFIMTMLNKTLFIH